MPYTEQNIGHRVRETSREAAESMHRSASTLRAQVLGAIKSAGISGMTADEAASKLNLTVLSVRPRVTELAMSGAIEATGGRRENVSGRKAAVWLAA